MVDRTGLALCERTFSVVACPIAKSSDAHAPARPIYILPLGRNTRSAPSTRKLGKAGIGTGEPSHTARPMTIETSLAS
jgi:hypothetical protein